MIINLKDEKIWHPGFVSVVDMMLSHDMTPLFDAHLEQQKECSDTHSIFHGKKRKKKRITLEI